MAAIVLWTLVLLAGGAFAWQLATRIRLIAAASDHFSFDHPAHRIWRFIVDVLLQWTTLRERPIAGAAHAFVFWGFVAFAVYTIVEFLFGLGLVDLTQTNWFHTYRLMLIPFASAVLLGIVYLLIRRAVFRPIALGTSVSIESVVIALFITALMATFLAVFRLDESSAAGRTNWW